jgi:antitoxin component of MazEF toxin-antitoxin module
MLRNMALMKIRRQGRSLAVTLDAETLREAQLREGDLVRPKVENGRVVLEPVTLTPGVRPEVMEAIERAVSENRAVLKRLGEYDSE